MDLGARFQGGIRGVALQAHARLEVAAPHPQHVALDRTAQGLGTVLVAGFGWEHARKVAAQLGPDLGLESGQARRRLGPRGHAAHAPPQAVSRTVAHEFKLAHDLRLGTPTRAAGPWTYLGAQPTTSSSTSRARLW